MLLLPKICNLYFRYMIGPMPFILCKGNFFLKLTFTLQGLLFLDGCILIRYISIFWLKNPAAFQDEFWSFFINIWVVAGSWLAHFVFELFLRCENMHVNICTGFERSENNSCFKHSQYINLNMVFAYTSISIHAIIYIRIQIYKLGTCTVYQVFSQSKQFWVNYLEEHSLLDLTTNFLTAIVTVTAMFAPQIIRLIFLNDFYTQPHYLNEYFYTMIRPPTTVFLLTVIYYLRNRRMTISVWREVKDIYYNIFT